MLHQPFKPQPASAICQSTLIAASAEEQFLGPSISTWPDAPFSRLSILFVLISLDTCASFIASVLGFMAAGCVGADPEKYAVLVAAMVFSHGAIAGWCFQDSQEQVLKQSLTGAAVGSIAVIEVSFYDYAIGADFSDLISIAAIPCLLGFTRWLALFILLKDPIQRLARRAVILGGGDRALQMVLAIGSERYIRLIGIIDERNCDASSEWVNLFDVDEPFRQAGCLNTLFQLVREQRIEVIFVGSSSSNRDRIFDILQDLNLSRTEVFVENEMLDGRFRCLRRTSIANLKLVSVQIRPGGEKRRSVTSGDSSKISLRAPVSLRQNTTAGSRSPKPSETWAETKNHDSEFGQFANSEIGVEERLVLCQRDDALTCEDLLVLALTPSLRRREAHAIAQLLCRRFGSFTNAISAPVNSLQSVEGLGNAGIVALKILQVSSVRLLRAELQQRPVLANWDRLMDYLQIVLSRERIEHSRILFLNGANQLLSDEAQGIGTVDHVPVYPREVVKRALELNATALILVHNHPSGDPTPSRDDLLMTWRVRRAADALGISVHDHLIVGSNRIVSLRREGLLEPDDDDPDEID